MTDMRQTTLVSYAHRHFLLHRAALAPEQQHRFATVDEGLFKLTEAEFILNFERQQQPNRSVPRHETKRVAESFVGSPRARRTVTTVLVLIFLAAFGWYFTRSTPLEKLRRLHLPYGPPGDLSMIVRKGYAFAYDPVRRLPTWVAYRVNPGRGGSPKNTLDPDVDHQLSAHDYKKASMDKSKLIPVNNVSGGLTKQELTQLAYYSVLAPHHPNVRRGLKMELDRMIVSYAAKGPVNIVRGPIYKNSKKKIGGVDIPDFYFCLIIRKNQDGVIEVDAYKYANQATKQILESNCRTTVKNIEKETGLNFPNVFKTRMN